MHGHTQSMHTPKHAIKVCTHPHMHPPTPLMLVHMLRACTHSLKYKHAYKCTHTSIHKLTNAHIHDSPHPKHTSIGTCTLMCAHVSANFQSIHTNACTCKICTDKAVWFHACTAVCTHTQSMPHTSAHTPGGCTHKHMYCQAFSNTKHTHSHTRACLHTHRCTYNCSPAESTWQMTQWFPLQTTAGEIHRKLIAGAWKMARLVKRWPHKHKGQNVTPEPT